MNPHHLYVNGRDGGRALEERFLDFVDFRAVSLPLAPLRAVSLPLAPLRAVSLPLALPVVFLTFLPPPECQMQPKAGVQQKHREGCRHLTMRP